MKNMEELVQTLNHLVSRGVITPARRVDLGTFVVFNEYMENGQVIYHQYLLEQLPVNVQMMMDQRRANERFDRFHILNVFDVWEF